MIRRSPTRIDLRLDDLAEYETKKKEREAKKDTDKQSGYPQGWGAKPSQIEIQERIGYVPGTPQVPPTRTNLTL